MGYDPNSKEIGYKYKNINVNMQEIAPLGNGGDAGPGGSP